MTALTDSRSRRVLSFGTERATASQRSSETQMPSLEPRPVERVERGQVVDFIKIKQLYASPETARPAFYRALQLLDQAVSLAQSANQAIRDSDVLEADRKMERLQALLRPLFECHEIGEGYANIVNTIHLAFAQQAGRPLNVVQITTILRVLKQLSTQPVMTFESSLEQVRELRKAGLQIAPRAIELLVGGPTEALAEGLR